MRREPSMHPNRTMPWFWRKTPWIEALWGEGAPDGSLGHSGIDGAQRKIPDFAGV